MDADAEEARGVRRNRVLALLVSLAVLPPLVLGALMIRSGRAILHQQAVARFRLDAESRMRAVEEFLSALRLDLLFLSRSGKVKDLAGRDDLHPDAWSRARAAAEAELLSFSVGRRAVYQVRYIDEHGREVVRLNLEAGRAHPVAVDDLQDKRDRYYVRESLALPPGRIYVSRMDVNIEHGQVELPRRYVVRFGARVTDHDGTPRGVVVLNIDADYVFSLLGSLPIDTEAWLLDENGQYLAIGGTSKGGERVLRTVEDAVRIDQTMPELAAEILSPSPEGRAVEGEGMLLFSRPLRLDADESTGATAERDASSQAWRFVLARQQSSIDAPVQSMTRYLFALLAAVVAIAGASGAAVARSLHRTTRRLSEARAELKATNASLEAEVRRRIEEIRAMEHGLLRVDKLASIGQLTAGVLHEVGNPLAAIKTKIQVAEEEGVPSPEQAAILSEVLREVDRLSTFLRSFSRLSRLPPASPRRIDPSELVASLQALVGPEMQRRRLRIDATVAPDAPPIYADPDQVRQVMINLILNAAEASPRSGAILVRVTPDLDEHRVLRGVCVAVEDDGWGIAADDQPRVFDPFFTTRPDGSGLGLSICRRIVESQDGRIELDSEAGRGTVVSISLPTTPPSNERMESP